MTEKVQVVTRIRPRVTTSGPTAVFPIDESHICVDGRRVYSVDRVYAMEDSTEVLFYDRVVALADRFLSGFNTTILAYGQTGSGKTYTMNGLATLVLKFIVERMGGSTDMLSFQCVEVYGESLRDLLSSDPAGSARNLRLCEGGTSAGVVSPVIVMGAARVKARSMEEVQEIIDYSHKMRATGATAMNEHSSRSHRIFVVFNHRQRCKFNLVDLAGSERNRKTCNVGQRFRESIAINGGLLALGNVIRALSRNHFSCPDNPRHVPYRSSKLTRLLQDSLGGNSTTLLIACVSADVENVDETVRTLQYSAIASHILNEPLPHADEQLVPEAAVVRNNDRVSQPDFAAEAQALRRRVAELEDRLQRCCEELKNDETVFAQQISHTEFLLAENEALKQRISLLENQNAATPRTPVSAPVAKCAAPIETRELRAATSLMTHKIVEGLPHRTLECNREVCSAIPLYNEQCPGRVRGDQMAANGTCQRGKSFQPSKAPLSPSTEEAAVAATGYEEIRAAGQVHNREELNTRAAHRASSGRGTLCDRVEHEEQISKLAKEALYYQKENNELRRRLRTVIDMYECQQKEALLLRREVEQIRDLLDNRC
ncbi:Microtubule binding Kinesin motor domain [Trypanosoma vivax]|nr:putative kinesin [Trypanosoma vivax]KAH8613042.1 Microtubule binding Kinesin motor domain [Trypanosoma vivax]